MGQTGKIICPNERKNIGIIERWKTFLFIETGVEFKL
jgi:hypothetical protein